MAKRIPLRELDRFQRELTRFMNAVERHYPGFAATGIGPRLDDGSEVIRSAATAEGLLPGWTNYRRNNRRDPWEED